MTDQYKSAVSLSGLVGLLAACYYTRIFISWMEGCRHPDQLEVVAACGNAAALTVTGLLCNDAYRYMDRLSAAPLLRRVIPLAVKLPAGMWDT